MSSRKFIRNRLRKDAEYLGVKTGPYIKKMFDRYAIKKYGDKLRLIHQARGTHPRRTWRMREAFALYCCKQKKC